MDPNVDPELALALRLSMEEERARQEAIAKKAAEDTSNTENNNASSSNSDSVMAEAEPASNAAAGDKKEQPKVLSLSISYKLKMLWPASNASSFGSCMYSHELFSPIFHLKLRVHLLTYFL